MCIHYCKCPSVMPPDQKSVQKAVQAKSILKETPSCPASPTWKSVRSLVMLNICPCKQGREITCGSSVSITTAVTYVGRQPHLVDPLFPRAAKRSTNSVGPKKPLHHSSRHVSGLGCCRGIALIALGDKAITDLLLWFWVFVLQVEGWCFQYVSLVCPSLQKYSFRNMVILN